MLVPTKKEKGAGLPRTVIWNEPQSICEPFGVPAVSGSGSRVAVLLTRPPTGAAASEDAIVRFLESRLRRLEFHLSLRCFSSVLLDVGAPEAETSRRTRLEWERCAGLWLRAVRREARRSQVVLDRDADYAKRLERGGGAG